MGKKLETIIMGYTYIIGFGFRRNCYIIWDHIGATNVGILVSAGEGAIQYLFFGK